MTRIICRNAETETTNGIRWLAALSDAMLATFPDATTINLYYQEPYAATTCGVVGYGRYPFSFNIRTDLALDEIPATLEQWRDQLIEQQERIAAEQGLA